MKKVILLAVVALMMTACNNKQETNNTDNMKQQLVLTQEWDKVFPLSEKVNHRKVTFETQYGLTLAADLYTPKDAQGKLMGPQQTPGGAVVAPYKIVMVKKTGQINSSVIAALKNIGNQQPGKTMFGQIQCTELK